MKKILILLAMSTMAFAGCTINRPAPGGNMELTLPPETLQSLKAGSDEKKEYTCSGKCGDTNVGPIKCYNPPHTSCALNCVDNPPTITCI